VNVTFYSCKALFSISKVASVVSHYSSASLWCYMFAFAVVTGDGVRITGFPVELEVCLHSMCTCMLHVESCLPHHTLAGSYIDSRSTKLDTSEHTSKLWCFNHEINMQDEQGRWTLRP